MTAQAPHHPPPFSRVIDAVAALRDACAACVEAVDPGAPTAPPAPSAATPDALAVARHDALVGFMDVIEFFIKKRRDEAGPEHHAVIDGLAADIESMFQACDKRIHG